MNGWDLFTWFMTFVLGGSAVVIFLFFLRDARGVLRREITDEPSDE
jgi:hypothetical protein